MPINNQILLTGDRTIPAVLPGPMEGIMHPLFCRTVAELDLLPCWITPFLRISTAVPRKPKIRNFLAPYLGGEVPVILQLMGVSPELLAETAARALECGIIGINLNFACPSRQVLSSGAGGALLSSPDLMHLIVQAVSKTCRGHSLSIKIRSGRNSPEELQHIIPAVTDGAAPDFIALHFRTVKENYGKVNNSYERIAAAVKLAGTVPVIANGDILTEDDAAAMLRNTSCHGVMVARGMIKDPFMIKRLIDNSPTLPDAEFGRNIFFNHALTLAARYPELYWHRSWLIELANFMWGSGSKEFKRLLTLSNDEFLNDSLIPMSGQS